MKTMRSKLFGPIILLMSTYIGFLLPQGILIGLLYQFKRFRPSIIQHKNILIASCTIPHILWYIIFTLLFISGSEKTLSNAFLEPILIGVTFTIINAFFIVKPPRNKTYWIASLIIVPLAVYFLVPGLME